MINEMIPGGVHQFRSQQEYEAYVREAYVRQAQATGMKQAQQHKPYQQTSPTPPPEAPRHKTEKKLLLLEG